MTPQWIGFTACVVRTPENEDNTQSADQEERDVGYDVAEILDPQQGPKICETVIVWILRDRWHK